MKNPDMIKMAMEQMKKNPDMLKNMSKMLGDNHPLSGLLSKSSPEDLEKMISTMSKFSGVITTFLKCFGFVK